MIKTGDQKRTALTAKFIKERIFGINIIINHQNFYPELLNKIFIQIPNRLRKKTLPHGQQCSDWRSWSR